MSSTETDCANGLDDDMDGAVDCADLIVQVKQFRVTICLWSETSCNDNQDNDGGDFDCDDMDCLGHHLSV